jgi:hypothetical protein
MPDLRMLNAKFCQDLEYVPKCENVFYGDLREPAIARSGLMGENYDDFVRPQPE